MPILGYKDHIDTIAPKVSSGPWTAPHAAPFDEAELPGLISKENVQHLAQSALRSNIHQKKPAGGPGPGTSRGQTMLDPRSAPRTSTSSAASRGRCPGRAYDRPRQHRPETARKRRLVSGTASDMQDTTCQTKAREKFIVAGVLRVTSLLKHGNAGKSPERQSTHSLIGKWP